MPSPKNVFASAAAPSAFIGVMGGPFSDWLVHRFNRADGETLSTRVQPTENGFVLIRPGFADPEKQAAFFRDANQELRKQFGEGRGLQAIAMATGINYKKHLAEPLLAAIRAACGGVPAVEISSGRPPTRLGFDRTIAPERVRQSFAQEPQVSYYEGLAVPAALAAAHWGCKRAPRC